MGFWRSLKNIGGKVLKVGGSVLRKIGDIGGGVADFAKNNAGMLGNILGTGLTISGFPQIGVPVAAAGNAIQQFAGDKRTQNVIRGIKDVGQAAQDGSRYLAG